MWFLRDFSKYEIKYRLIRLSLKPSNIYQNKLSMKNWKLKCLWMES